MKTFSKISNNNYIISNTFYIRKFLKTIAISRITVYNKYKYRKAGQKRIAVVGVQQD